VQGGDRIEVNPAILAGKPVIRGTRIPVYLLLDMLAAGATFEQILAEYPALHRADLEAALRYASRLLEHSEWKEFGVV
jgi:uncharacterized protein (DUF433 family)